MKSEIAIPKPIGDHDPPDGRASELARHPGPAVSARDRADRHHQHVGPVDHPRPDEVERRDAVDSCRRRPPSGCSSRGCPSARGCPAPPASGCRCRPRSSRHKRRPETGTRSRPPTISWCDAARCAPILSMRCTGSCALNRTVANRIRNGTMRSKVAGVVQRSISAPVSPPMRLGTIRMRKRGSASRSSWRYPRRCRPSPARSRPCWWHWR